MVNGIVTIVTILYHIISHFLVELYYIPSAFWIRDCYGFVLNMRYAFNLWQYINDKLMINQ